MAQYHPNQIFFYAGIHDGFIKNGVKRSCVSHGAFVAILFGFNCNGAKADQYMQQRQDLVLHLLDKLHTSELKDNGKTPSPKRKAVQSGSETPKKGTSQACLQTDKTTPLSSLENVSPIKHLVYSPVRTGKSTLELFDKEKSSNEEHQSGRKWKSRPLSNRIRIQESMFCVMSRRVHRGTKDDFLSALSCSVVADAKKVIMPDTGKWNGKLSVPDVIQLTKLIHPNEESQSLYDVLTEQHAAEKHHITAKEAMHVEDNCSASDAIDYVCKKFPGLISSSYAVNKLKCQMKKECEAVLRPERCATGWRVQPNRLHKCLQFVYPWLQSTNAEWWKLYGDARTYGRQKSVAFAIGNLNNEQVLNGCSYQSPKEMWPVCLFYGGDSRLNLELNLAEDSDWLNDWVASMETSGHEVYLTGDSMFIDAMAGSDLDPTSKDKFSI